MKIRYKIFLLVFLLTASIIVLLNISYIKIMTWATDKFVKEVLSHQVTNVLVNLPPEDQIDWDDMQKQIDQAMRGSDNLLYGVVYGATTDDIKLISMDVNRVQSLLNTNEKLSDPREIIRKLNGGELQIKNVREVEILARSAPKAKPLHVIIGYMLPIPQWVRTFIVWTASILILIFSAIAIAGSFLLAGGITKPIRTLASAMQEVSEGNMDVAVKVRSRDEVGQLARIFNSMMYQLKEKTAELEDLNRNLEEKVERAVAELRRRDEAEKQRLIGELQRAREVQMGLFPQSAPEIDGLDIWGVCKPASEVGGDFFDYLYIEAHRLCIALGDVSGKGMKGAMNAVMAYGMLHAEARVRGSTSEIIFELNESLSSRLEDATFTALSLGIIDINTREIELCNAGNPYPVLLRDGKATLVTLSGMPLGIITEIEYDETRFTMKPGDVIILYSDGISEAMASEDRMYGMESLKDLVGRLSPDLTAQQIVEKILEDVKRFTGDYPQSDDITVIAVKATG